MKLKESIGNLQKKGILTENQCLDILGNKTADPKIINTNQIELLQNQNDSKNNSQIQNEKTIVQENSERENSNPVSQKYNFNFGLLNITPEISLLCSQIMTLNSQLEKVQNKMKTAKREYFHNMLQRFKVVLFFHSLNNYFEKKIETIQEFKNRNKINKRSFDIDFYLENKEKLYSLSETIFPRFQFR